MKNQYPNRRCAECSRQFNPDRRVGARQVTCGRAECQRSRHADRCRAWHRRHRGETDHYRDVVVPFRERHPGYQRRHRLRDRLGEIREQMKQLAQTVASAAGRVERSLVAMCEEPPHERCETSFWLTQALVQTVWWSEQLEVMLS
jgi:hypothetical protein